MITRPTPVHSPVGTSAFTAYPAAAPVSPSTLQQRRPSQQSPPSLPPMYGRSATTSPQLNHSPPTAAVQATVIAVPQPLHSNNHHAPASHPHTSEYDESDTEPEIEDERSPNQVTPSVKHELQPPPLSPTTTIKPRANAPPSASKFVDDDDDTVMNEDLLLMTDGEHSTDDEQSQYSKDTDSPSTSAQGTNTATPTSAASSINRVPVARPVNYIRRQMRPTALAPASTTGQNSIPSTRTGVGKFYDYIRAQHIVLDDIHNVTLDQLRQHVPLWLLTLRRTDGALFPLNTIRSYIGGLQRELRTVPHFATLAFTAMPEVQQAIQAIKRELADMSTARFDELPQASPVGALYDDTPSTNVYAASIVQPATTNPQHRLSQASPSPSNRATAVFSTPNKAQHVPLPSAADRHLIQQTELIVEHMLCGRAPPADVPAGLRSQVEFLTMIAIYFGIFKSKELCRYDARHFTVSTYTADTNDSLLAEMNIPIGTRYVSFVPSNTTPRQVKLASIHPVEVDTSLHSDDHRPNLKRFCPVKTLQTFLSYRAPDADQYLLMRWLDDVKVADGLKHAVWFHTEPMTPPHIIHITRAIIKTLQRLNVSLLSTRGNVTQALIAIELDELEYYVSVSDPVQSARSGKRKLGDLNGSADNHITAQQQLQAVASVPSLQPQHQSQQLPPPALQASVSAALPSPLHPMQQSPPPRLASTATSSVPLAAHPVMPAIAINQAPFNRDGTVNLIAAMSNFSSVIQQQIDQVKMNVNHIQSAVESFQHFIAAHLQQQHQQQQTQTPPHPYHNMR